MWHVRLARMRTRRYHHHRHHLRALVRHRMEIRHRRSGRRRQGKLLRKVHRWIDKRASPRRRSRWARLRGTIAGVRVYHGRWRHMRVVRLRRIHHGSQHHGWRWWMNSHHLWLWRKDSILIEIGVLYGWTTHHIRRWHHGGLVMHRKILTTTLVRRWIRSRLLRHGHHVMLFRGLVEVGWRSYRVLWGHFFATGGVDRGCIAASVWIHSVFLENINRWSVFRTQGLVRRMRWRQDLQRCFLVSYIGLGILTTKIRFRCRTHGTGSRRI